MKQQTKTFLFSVGLLVFSSCVLVFGGCNKESKSGSDSSSGGEKVLEKPASSSTTGKNPFDKDASYALGMNIGANMKNSDISPDLNEFLRGIKDVLDEKKTRFTEEEAGEKMNAAFVAIAERANEKLKLEETGFFEENGKKPGITTTASGLQYEIITEGPGPRPLVTDSVRVNYTGTLRDGSEFDSSRGEPVEFPLTGVIPGFAEGIQLMNVGSTFNLYIPSELGYGTQGGGPFPPYSTLIFEVKLLEIMSGGQ